MVKRLEFNQEQTESRTRTSGETDNLDVRLGSAPPAPLAPPNMELNGGVRPDDESAKRPPADEEGEGPRVGENGRKRLLGEESEDWGSGVNGTAADPQPSANGGDRPHVNGTGAQDGSVPPPAKLPRLENHLGRGDGVVMATSNNLGAAPPATVETPLKTVSQVTTITSAITTVSTTSHTVVSGNGAPASVTVARSTAQCSTVTAVSSVTTTTSTGRSHHRTVSTRASGSMTLSKEYSTRDRVSLLRFSRCRKARSGTALPSYRKFVTKSSKKSIFVLPNDQLQRLARRAGLREVPIFSYTAKPAPDIWPYPSPRPTFAITWRSVTRRGAGGDVINRMIMRFC